MDIYFLSDTSFPRYFSLSLNPAIHRMSNAPNIPCPRCKRKEDSHLRLIFYCKLYKAVSFSKLVWKSHWELSSQFHYGVQLKILQSTILEVFLNIFPTVVGKLFGIADTIKLMNSLTLTVILVSKPGFCVYLNIFLLLQTNFSNSSCATQNLAIICDCDLHRK